MPQSGRRRVVASLVALSLLVLGVVAAAPASDGIQITPALEGATAVRKGQAVDISGQVDLNGGSSFILAAEFVGYDADGNEVVRQDATFNANRTSGDGGFIDIDADGNVVGQLGLGCEFGDATSLPQDRVHAACTAEERADLTEDQRVTAHELQLVVRTPDAEYHSGLLDVDPIPPVIEGYEVTSPTTILVTTSEPVVHPTGSESANDWRLPDGEAVVVGVARGSDDCAYGPGEDPRGGADGCTFVLTVSPALGRDATPRVLYEPSETRVTNPDDAKHVDRARNSMYLRSVEPTRGDRFDSLAADRVGPVAPSLDSVAGQPATDPDTGERLVLDNEPQPTVGLGGLTAGHGLEVQVDGVAAGTGTAAGPTADVVLDDALADGTYTITATASDTAACDPNDPGAGTCSNDSEPSRSVTYDLDTVAPTIVGDVLARPSSITVALSEDVSGPDDAADWTVSNPNGTAVSVDAVVDAGDGSASRRLRISGGPVAPGAELTYSPAGARYEDPHTNVLADVTVSLTIADLPVASIAADAGDEAASGLLGTTTPVTFTVTLDEPVAALETASVDYATTALGSATLGPSCDDGVDAVATSGTITFAAGQDTSDPIQVEVCADDLDEFDTESVVLELSDPRGLRLPGGQPTTFGIGTITDDDPAPVVDFTDPSPEVAEGESVTLTVELDAVSGKDVQVDWTTVFDLSADEADLPQQSGTVTIPAGRTTGDLEITTLQDLEVESGERFAVELATTGTSNAVEPDGGARVQVDIVDDDVLTPLVSLSGGEVDEDARGDLFLVEPGTVAFEVRLSEAVGRTVRVDYATTEAGTATPDEEFTPTSGTLEFQPGDTVGRVEVAISDDELDEFDETIELELRNPDGVAFPGEAPAIRAVGTILDDDPLVTVDLGDDVEVDEGEPATFDITLSAVSGKDVEVRIRTSDGSARAGSDYRATDQTLTISAGDTSTTVTIPTLDDSDVEATEDVEVSMSVVADDTAELGRSAAVLRIADDDLGVDPSDTVVSLTGDAVDEGDPLGPLSLPVGGNQLAFEISLNEPADGPVTIDYVTRAGTATPDDDFVPVSGSVTIADGEDRATVPVDVVADRTDEFDEDLQLVLTDVAGDAVLPSGELARTGRILDDDAQAQLRVSDATVLEAGTAELDVTLDGASGKPITVDWELVDGTATAGTDYVDGSGTLSFPAGTISRTVTVATLADADAAELIEQFALVLSAATNAGIDDPRGTVSIVDVGVDGLPTVTAVFLEDIRTTEADGDRTALVPVRLSAASDQDVTVTWTSQRLTAADGEDYVAEGGQVVVPAGATSTQIPVTIIGDDEVEPDEDFLVLLTEAEGAVITGPTGRVTIEDDDADDGADGGADGGADDGVDDGGAGPDGAPDGGEDRELAATGGGAGFVVLGLGLLAARRRREDA